MFSDFQGVWVPIVTPFRSGGVDHDALGKLARSFADKKISGLVTGATTGEGMLLEPIEVEAVYKTLRGAVPGMPLVLGLSEPVTARAVSRAKALASLGPQALLVTPPSYLRPNQEGIRRHFEIIAEAADCPLLVYNIPYRTGVQIEIETLQVLTRDPRVMGIKECGGTSDRMMRLVNETSLQVLSGDDSENFVALCLGARGTIAGAAHILPQWHVAMFERLQQGDIQGARLIASLLHPLICKLFAEPNPAPLKALLAREGRIRNDLRLPFVQVGEKLQQELADTLDLLTGQFRQAVAAGVLPPVSV